MEETKEITFSVPWGHIAAKTWGSPSSYPILCVHGILDNAGVFDRLIPQLPRDFYYVSIDLPGHGLSSHFPSGVPLDFFNYILAIRYILEQLKWKTFHYIGHSLGGQLGTFFSIIYPDQIQKLILIEGIAPKTTELKDIIPQIKKSIDSNLEVNGEFKNRLYTRDEVLYTLKYKRAVCLNTPAAEAIFKRSVSRVGDLYEFNRDYRLKSYVRPILSLDQMANIFSKLTVNALLFMTTSTINTIPKNYLTVIKTVVESTQNLNVIYVHGNHDVHNNHPERISLDISKFLNNNVSSKL